MTSGKFLRHRPFREFKIWKCYYNIEPSSPFNSIHASMPLLFQSSAHSSGNKFCRTAYLRICERCFYKYTVLTGLFTSLKCLCSTRIEIDVHGDRSQFDETRIQNKQNNHFGPRQRFFEWLESQSWIVNSIKDKRDKRVFIVHLSKSSVNVS